MATVKPRFFSLIVLLCCSALAFANHPSVYQRYFPGLNVRTTTKVAPAPDGGIVLLADYTDGDERGLWLIRYDACDELVWSNRYTFPQTYISNGGLVVTPENEVMVTGFYQNAEGYQGFLIKIDERGEVIFAQTVETGLNEYFYSIGRLTSGQYFVYGNRSPTAGSNFNNIVLRFDNDGKVLSAKTYFAIPIWGWAIATSDGGILARTGRTFYKIHQNGNLDWGTSVDAIGYYESTPVEVDDGYVYARYSTTGSPGVPAYLFKLNKAGALTWVSEGFKCQYTTDLEVLPDGTFLVAGVTSDPDLSGGETVSMYTHIDANGQILEQWYQTYDGNSQALGGSCIDQNKSLYQTGYFIDQNTGLSTLALSKVNKLDEFLGCNAFPMESKLEIDKPNTLAQDVAPHDLAVTLIPIPVEVKPQPVNPVTLCYEKEPLSIDLGKDTTLCGGIALSIGDEQATGSASYLWSTGATTPTIDVNSPGTYTLTVVEECETVSDTIVIDQYPITELYYEIEPKNANPFSPVHFRANTKTGQKIWWQYGFGETSDTSFHYLFDQNGWYPVRFTLTDEYGCTYSDTSSIRVRYFSLFVPNSFTPNGDGINDRFQPEGFGIANYHLRIYNRWGEVVFDKENEGWNGDLDGRVLPTGAYVYLLEVIDDFGEFTTKKGMVHLLR
jgi:gliding motility-associated-like protein